MAKKTRLRRCLKVGLAVPNSTTSLEGKESRVWDALVRDLRIAEARRAVAMRQLFAAERRYFARPPEKRVAPEPAWYRTARQAEARRAAVVERLNWRIVQTRATTLDALAVKVRLMASAYGINLSQSDAAEHEVEDLVACLMRSLVGDLARRRAEGGGGAV